MSKVRQAFPASINGNARTACIARDALGSDDRKMEADGNVEGVDASAATNWVGALGRASPDFGEELLVGRERWWLPSANRYSFKTLLELGRIALGPARPMKGTREATLANMRRFLRQRKQGADRVSDPKERR